MRFTVRSSEGLVLSPAVMQMVLMVRVVEVVGLVPMVAVADDGVLDAFTLQVLLLVDALQLPQQLLDENLRGSAARLFIIHSATSRYVQMSRMSCNVELMLLIVQICQKVSRSVAPGFSINEKTQTHKLTRFHPRPLAQL